MPEPAAPACATPEVACWTHAEIAQQPRTLRATHDKLVAEREAIEAFLGPVLADARLRIVLTGAGTSAFVGSCLAPWLARALEREVIAVPTTDLVATPALHLAPARPTLLVSFGRSGDSPESVAALDLADRVLPQVHHLIITCNAEGALAGRGAANVQLFVLPEATHDRGFAMTSSFSGMMLAALAMLTGIGAVAARISTICGAVAQSLERARALNAKLAARRFERVVYLGSGVFGGLAREAALKTLELTDGDIATLSDTPLGFRHGPKSFVDARTLVVLFLSGERPTRSYDLDLVSEIRSDGRAAAVLVIGGREDDADALALPEAEALSDVERLFPYVVPAQLFALTASLTLGHSPDLPSRGGTVNRVVQGVRIHPA